MTEYVLVITLVSLLAGGVVSRVANQLRFRFGEVASALGGQTSVVVVGATPALDMKAMTPANLKKTQFEE